MQAVSAGLTLARRRYLALCTASFGLFFIGSAASANELDDARNAGLIGERPDGLVGIVPESVPADVVSLMEMVNRARMDSYRALAAKEGADVAAVQAVAGERQIEKAVQNGWYVMDADGSWRRR